MIKHFKFNPFGSIRRHQNLTVRNEESRQPAEPIDLGEPPSIEEAKGWAESFDKLMLSPAGRRYFRDFLRSEYSEENILFWMSCEALKNEQNPEIIEEKARLIYEDYISILSPKEVSLDSRVREVINRNMVEPSPHTFDEAQLQIYTLMHRDSYPRFINSQLYRRLLRKESVNT
jgi:regulator of G-protein signaling